MIIKLYFYPGRDAEHYPEAYLNSGICSYEQ